MRCGPSGAVFTCWLSLIGIALFCRGFFTVKTHVTSYNTHDDSAISPLLAPLHDGQPAGRPPNPAFNRLAFVLVDALRSDFAFGPRSEMSFVQSLVKDGRALAYTAVAQAPTVTLPRLKALTTGSNPTFLDAVLNIAEDSSTSAFLEHTDSWLRQLVQPGPGQKRVVFAGDDTWLRIFPSHWFTWSEGVSSFFVADTVTVDTNVTRHLDRLLDASDPRASWDALILHYLGLDHVGHLGGSMSHLMGPKQREMDDIIKRVFQYLEHQDAADGQNSLLVLVGDHGMTEMGNHGGSTEAETSAALLFASPSKPLSKPSNPAGSKQYHLHEVVQQIDLAPTISTILGLPIPKNSMGRVIVSALEGFDIDIRTSLYAGVRQLISVLDLAAPGATVNLIKAIAPSGRLTTVAEMNTFLQAAQDRLMSTFGDYNLLPMTSGLVLLALASLVALADAQEAWRTETASLRHTVAILLTTYLATFFASSFVEEEHELWFAGSAGLVWLAVTGTERTVSDRAWLMLAAASVRIMRGWSLNGQKNVPNNSISSILAGSPVTSRRLVGSSIALLAFMPILILFRAARTLSRRQDSSSGQASPHRLFTRALSFAVLLVISLLQVSVLAVQKMTVNLAESAVLRHLDLDNPVALARAGYILALLGWMGASTAVMFDRVASVHYRRLKLVTLATVLASLSRTTNIPLFLLMTLQMIALSRARLSPLTQAALVTVLQHVAFFAAGGSNSLATVDLSQAYNGIAMYDIRWVSIITFLSNFSGPVLWSAAANTLLDDVSAPQARSARCKFFTAFYTTSLFTLAVSATHFRGHLFVWTVFSPALLYKGVWTLLVHWTIGTVATLF